MKFKKIVFLLLIIVLLTSCTKKQEIVQEENTVIIRDFAFNPSTIIINKGTEIMWTNEDSAPHIVKSEGVFESGTLIKGDSFTFVFNELGTYEYLCKIHPYMKGSIIVN